MTKYLFKSAFILMAIVMASCSNDDDTTPVPVNEEEVITTLTATLTPQGGGTPVILQSRDLDGDGPNAPVVTVSGNLTAGTTYDAAIVLLNETENPPENITLEVIEEAEEHQFLFFTSGSLNATITYVDFDSDGNPLGTQFTLDAGTASAGALRIILKHEPTKPNDGTILGAGGETDIDVTFDITIQ